jgi:chemotaxis protein MotB
VARLHRKPKHEAHENHERYLITYADMITLLLVFFIVLFSISNADKEKFLQISTSLREAFRVDVLSVPDTANGGPSSLESDPRFMTYLSVRAQVATMINRLQIPSADADVELTSEGIIIHLSEAVLFPPGESALRPEGQRVLDELANIIGPLPNQVRVEGNTDNVQPPEGVALDNWELSALRSVATVRYLTDMQQIAPERLAAVGYGQFRPRGDNATLDGRRQNRRVDFVIIQRDPANGSIIEP